MEESAKQQVCVVVGRALALGQETHVWLQLCHLLFGMTLRVTGV